MIDYEKLKLYKIYWDERLGDCLDVFAVNHVLVDMAKYITDGGVILI